MQGRVAGTAKRRMYCQVCGDTSVWDQCIWVDVCMLHRKNLRDARDGGGEGGAVYVQSGDDLLTPSHVTSNVVVLMGGRVAGRRCGRAAFGRLIRVSRKGRIESLDTQ